MRKKPKVFVAMSGGVDSSVAAALLKKAATPKDFEKIFGRPTPEGFRGFDVRGVHIKMWSDPSIPCNFKEDRYDAMRVAAKLDIPFETWDFTKEYREAVVEYMIREYAQGRTPNPDVMCNRHIKFGIFLKKALELGADFVATGHYVRTANVADKRGLDADLRGRIVLMKAKDANKDQSYFLWTLTQEQLKHCLFPIGEYIKPEVRKLAKKLGLSTADKPDSQGICFIGEINIRDFLKNHISVKRGKVLTTSGKIVGEHEGLFSYTLGQREGIGIGGGIPYYVAGKDFKTNTLVVAEGPYDAKLFSNDLIATEINWTSGKEPKLFLHCEARIRYRQPLQSCRIEAQSYADKTQNNAEFSATVRVRSAGVRVLFEQSQRAITPGQSVVFYKGQEMLGGGIIV